MHTLKYQGVCVTVNGVFKVIPFVQIQLATFSGIYTCPLTQDFSQSSALLKPRCLWVYLLKGKLTSCSGHSSDSVYEFVVCEVEESLPVLSVRLRQPVVGC